MGRFVSAVIGRAASKLSPVFFTQMLRVPLYGFRNDRNCPSGEIWAPAISGSPKKSSRSMIGGWPPEACEGCGELAAGTDTRPRPAMASRERTPSPRNRTLFGIAAPVDYWDGIILPLRHARHSNRRCGAGVDRAAHPGRHRTRHDAG